MSSVVPWYPNAIAPKAQSQSSAIFGRRPKQHRNPTLLGRKSPRGKFRSPDDCHSRLRILPIQPRVR